MNDYLSAYNTTVLTVKAKKTTFELDVHICVLSHSKLLMTDIMITKKLG